jgi:hypothetical protein
MVRRATCLITAWLGVRVLPAPPRTPTLTEISRFSALAPNWPASLRGPVSAKASSNFLACFGAFVSVHEIPFPGNRDFSSKRRGSNARLLGGKAKHLVLAGPFGRQVDEAGDAHAVGKPTLDGCLNKIRRQECQRDSHVDLARAASLVLGNAFRSGFWIGREFVEPAPATSDRRNQCCPVFRADRAKLLRSNSFRHSVTYRPSDNLFRLG